MVMIEKVLTNTDVTQRLGVTREMLNILPPHNREHDVPVRVLDDTGMVYEFNLSVRVEGALKPVFQYQEWRAFVNRRNIKAGDIIYFWEEASVAHRTEYRIALLRTFV
ncbi:PREDICTED: B3 domain-containing [Prunus dulcis]|uniref:PREDICTED: B3 domain-containing n=1 Tax=Prunus dulcis TaxID=3755 RepID=A0A5E4FIU7_PRUDU|nr:hypothetical protein L3X38_043704 [Prunus dulcis]VVA26661.1 PREDICTED: B3 domain-containing [Prunus dulcis]